MIDNGVYELAPIIPTIDESVGEYLSDFVDSFLYNISSGNKFDIEKLKPMLLKKAKKAKNMERIRYLRQDLAIAKRQIGTLASNVQSVMNGKPKKNLNVQYIKKQIDNGLTPDKIRAYGKWLETDYTKALNDRARELKAPKNESVLTESIGAAVGLIGLIAGAFGISYIKDRMEKNKNRKSHDVKINSDIKEALKIKNGETVKSYVPIIAMKVVGCSAAEVSKYLKDSAETNPEWLSQTIGWWEDIQNQSRGKDPNYKTKGAVEALKKFKGTQVYHLYDYGKEAVGFYSAKDNKVYEISIAANGRAETNYTVEKLMSMADREECSVLEKEYVDAYKDLKLDESVNTLDESIGAARNIFYRMSESEMFQNANRMAKINNEELFNVLPRMVVDGEGFAQLDMNDLDPTVVYELFESNRFRISCKKAMKSLLSSGKVVMVYGDEYRIPTCVPYLIQSTQRGARVFVNITPFTSINQYGKVRVTQIRNYSGLMAVLFAACVAYAIARGNMNLPSDLCDGLVLFYAGMMTKVINSLVHADSIQKETCKYLCAEFAFVQMYGTEYGTTVFQRFKNKYFPKLGKLVVNSIDDTFHIDSFDNMTLFVEELKRNYPIMKGLTVSAISEKWMRNFGSATALSLDYIGFHIYNLCMLLFESPLVSRMALEPLIDQKRGTDAFKRMQIMIEQSE